MNIVVSNFWGTHVHILPRVNLGVKLPIVLGYVQIQLI